MELGELFLIEDARMGVEERVLWAARYYRKKYGQAPTLCLMHPSLLGGERRRLGGLRLEARQSILPNYVWVGAPTPDGAAKPLAR